MKCTHYTYICFYLFIFCFSALCAGTLFAVSYSFMDHIVTPKWYTFYYGVPLLILLIIGMKQTGRSFLFKRLNILFFILITFCFLQAACGVLQYFHFLFPYENHRVTGSFDNPAGFAASLCAGLPFAVCFFQDKRKWLRYYSVAVVIVMSMAIVLSFSRSGILCLTVLISLFILSKTSVKNRLKISALMTVFLLIVFSTLYILKKDSADGRLLIWRCSLEMVKDNPLLGHGYAGFTANYMNYQAQYFKENPRNEYAALADNIHHPFNEYILLLTNYGLLGLILLVGFFYKVWQVYRKKYKLDLAVRVSGWSLLSILLFSFFSYPFFYPFVWAIMVLSLGVIFSDRFVFWKINGYIWIPIATLLFAVTYQNMRYELIWRKINRESLAGHTRRVLPQYDYLHTKFGYNRLFLYNYATELNYINEYAKSRMVATECSRMWADYYLQLMIAENLLKEKKYEESERHFKLAGNMCPVRFMPPYKLVKIYIETERREEARMLANKILTMKIKIRSPVINAIKKEMRLFVDHSHPESESHQ